jgi:hypothetical protein
MKHCAGLNVFSLFTLLRGSLCPSGYALGEAVSTGRAVVSRSPTPWTKATGIYFG